MTALACGLDLVEVNKLRRILYDRAGLVAELFTPQERSECSGRKDAWQHFAGHFAAKEAFLKALGLGFYAAGIAAVLRDVEVVCSHEKPELKVGHWVERLSRRRGFCVWHLSLAATSAYAAAAVVLVAASSGATSPRASARRG